jgi:DNA-binding response OmpR family regulator
MAKILVVEDDPVIGESVKKALETERYKVDLAVNVSAARDYLSAFSYDLLILDWELPDGTGVELCKDRRKNGDATPVLMLTARADVKDVELGLDTGADDYVPKPFESRALLARVRALLRRPATIVGNVLKSADLEFDTLSLRVRRGSRVIDLQPHEMAVLEYLMRNPNVVFSTEQLMRRCWPSDREIGEEAVYTCVRRLRKKLSLPEERQLITTLHGSGYRFEADPA